MNSHFITTLSGQPFSPARRIFILESMILRLEYRDLYEYAHAAQALITMEHRVLRRQANSHRPSRDHIVDPPHEHFSHASIEGQKRRCHAAFVELIALLIDELPPSTVVYLVEPVRRQLSRLQRFDTSDLQRPANAQGFAVRTPT